MGCLFYWIAYRVQPFATGWISFGSASSVGGPQKAAPLRKIVVLLTAIAQTRPLNAIAQARIAQDQCHGEPAEREPWWLLFHEVDHSLTEVIRDFVRLAELTQMSAD